MKIMTRAGWEKAVMDGERWTFGGGDLWNTANVWRKAFEREPDAVAARYDYIGTGLWVDVTLTLADGRRVERRLYS